MSLSDAELDQIEERARRASPSPWEAFVFPNPNDQDFIRIGGLDDAQPDMYIEQYVGATKMTVPTRTLISSHMHGRTFRHWWLRFVA